MTDNSEGNITTQIAYGNEQWGLAPVIATASVVPSSAPLLSSPRAISTAPLHRR